MRLSLDNHNCRPTLNCKNMMQKNTFGNSIYRYLHALSKYELIFPMPCLTVLSYYDYIKPKLKFFKHYNSQIRISKNEIGLEAYIFLNSCFRYLCLMLDLICNSFQQLENALSRKSISLTHLLRTQTI